MRSFISTGHSVVFSVFVSFLGACGSDGNAQNTNSNNNGAGGNSGTSNGTAGSGGAGGRAFDAVKDCVISADDLTGQHLDARCNGKCHCPNRAALEETCHELGLAVCPAGDNTCARGCSLDLPLDVPTYVPLDPNRDADARCINNLIAGGSEYSYSRGGSDPNHPVYTSFFLNPNDLGQYVLQGLGAEDGLLFIGQEGFTITSRRSVWQNSESMVVHMLNEWCDSFEVETFAAGSTTSSGKVSYYNVHAHY